MIEAAVDDPSTSGTIEADWKLPSPYPNNPYLYYCVTDQFGVCTGVYTGTENGISSGVGCTAGFSYHGTGVAGDLRSTHPTYKGMVTNITLRNNGLCRGCSATSAEFTPLLTDLATWGAKVINLSWGCGQLDACGTNRTNLGVFDTDADNFVYTQARLIVKSAGNTAKVTSPGLGYNVLTVGGINDENNSGWSDDTMMYDGPAMESAWVDPCSTHNDHFKPEVVAPAQGASSTACDGMYTTFYKSTPAPDPDGSGPCPVPPNPGSWLFRAGAGTSHAAPIVAGIAAKLIQKNVSLGSKPESLRAIIMASARHNIEGATFFSDKDGAGAVDASYAAGIVTGNVGGHGWKSSFPCAVGWTWLGSFYPVAGTRSRVVAAWPTPTTGGTGYPNAPNMDIDVYVYVGGSMVAWGGSVDNTWGLAEFTAASSASHDVWVYQVSCSAAAGRLGWAWVTNLDAP